MKADDILRFELLMRLLLVDAPQGACIETLFRQAATLAGLQDQVWLDAPVNLPRRRERSSAAS